MIHIQEKCLRSLNQEPGGSLCVQYRYRVEDTSLQKLLELKRGNTIVEFISDHKLFTKELGEVLGVDFNTIKIINREFPASSSENSVPV